MRGSTVRRQGCGACRSARRAGSCDWRISACCATPPAPAGLPTTGLSIVQANRFYKLRAKAVVMATGSLEQPAVFRNNDLPGVMMGSAAQRLIRLYGVRPGRRAVVIAANDDAYGVALDLGDAGCAGPGRRRSAPARRRHGAGARGTRPRHAHPGRLRGRRGHGRHWQAWDHRRHRRADRCRGRDGRRRASPSNATSSACRRDTARPDNLLHHAGTRFAYDQAANMFCAGGPAAPCLRRGLGQRHLSPRCRAGGGQARRLGRRHRMRA